MTLEDTLRWAETWPMERWPETYSRSYPGADPNWRWLDLWTQENPQPENREDFDGWYALRKAMHDRVWVAWAFPQFQVFDWDEEDVALARKLVARHVCGVCGRPDDSGCCIGC